MHDLSTTLKGTLVSALYSSLPTAQGLYDPANEHDACGVAFVATLTGVASNDIVAKGLTALRNLDHRGAVGGEPDTGDGAGILLQVPDRFVRGVADFDLPEQGRYAAGIAYLPADPDRAAEAKTAIEALTADEGLTFHGWRDVPVHPSILGNMALGAMPSFSRAMSMIGRFLAAWAISMSDFGDWCCEVGMGGNPSGCGESENGG